MQRESFGEIFTELFPLASGGKTRMMADSGKKLSVGRGHFCAAVNCTNSQYKPHCRGKSFFRFPRDKQRYVWLYLSQNLMPLNIYFSFLNVQNPFKSLIDWVLIQARWVYFIFHFSMSRTLSGVWMIQYWQVDSGALSTSTKWLHHRQPRELEVSLTNSLTIILPSETDQL